MGFNGGFYKRQSVLRHSFARTARICCAAQTDDAFRRLFTGVNVAHRVAFAASASSFKRYSRPGLRVDLARHLDF
jgi:phosphoribulokinase